MNRIFVCLLFLCTSGVCAETPVPFGFFIVETPNLFSGLVSKEASLKSSGSAQILFDPRRKLQSIERKLGPYHPDLVSPLLDLAQVAAGQGEIALADELYNQALHNARINSGLYSDVQAPILKDLLQLYLKSGNRNAFEARLGYQFRLLGSGYPPFEEKELVAAAQFFDATLDRLIDVQWEGRGRETLELHDRLFSLRNSVCENESMLSWCQDFTFRLLRFYYALDHKLDLVVSDPRFERAFGAPGWQYVDLEPRLEELQRRLYQRGRDILEKMVHMFPEEQDNSLALADWHWFYNKRSRALDLYKELAQLEPESFKTPKPLPQVPVVTRLFDFQPTTVNFTATLSVNSRGRTQEVEILFIDEVASERGRSLARRLLRETLFRPSLDDTGLPIDSSAIQLDLTMIP